MKHVHYTVCTPHEDSGEDRIPCSLDAGGGGVEPQVKDGPPLLNVASHLGGNGGGDGLLHSRSEGQDYWVDPGIRFSFRYKICYGPF